MKEENNSLASLVADPGKQECAHTPGPWTLADDGTIRAPLDPRGGVLMGDYRGEIICDLKPSVGSGETWPTTARDFAMPEALANARLIASAPSLASVASVMLGALKDCRDYLQEICADMPKCKPNSGEWCSKFCHQYGCAQMRVEHCERAINGINPSEG